MNASMIMTAGRRETARISIASAMPVVVATLGARRSDVTRSRWTESVTAANGFKVSLTAAKDGRVAVKAIVPKQDRHRVGPVWSVMSLDGGERPESIAGIAVAYLRLFERYVSDRPEDDDVTSFTLDRFVNRYRQARERGERFDY